MGIEEQIKEIEDEIKNTKYNKVTQHHIGKLKAKLARLKESSEKKSGGKGRAFAIKKSGNATVGLIGFPSVGKSTLLNKITDAHSQIGEYDFTTIDIVPGVMKYKGAKIQILDMPGMIKDASKGRGRGREIISVARTVDLIVMLVDVFHNEQLNVLLKELNDAGIRLNSKPPDIVLRSKERGGISVNSTVKMTKIDEKMIKNILNEYSYINADIVIRENINEDRLIDFLSKNRAYIHGFVVLNKIDLADEKDVRKSSDKLKRWEIVPISADKNINLDLLKEKIFKKLNFIRVYMKHDGKTDYDEPMVVKEGSNVGMICDNLRRDFRKKFRYAYVWGKSALYPGQMVGFNHVLMDEDVLTLVLLRKTLEAFS